MTGSPIPRLRDSNKAAGAQELPRRRLRSLSPKLRGLCPACHKGRLELDGCLNLACPACGNLVSGAFT